jgi:lipoprotein NlpI
LSPESDDGYACRGTAYFDAGDPRKAEADFRVSLGIEPCQPEILMRLLVVAAKNGSRVESRLICQAIASPEAKEWPGPLIGFLLRTGQAVRDKLHAAVSPGGSKKPVPERHCEAAFFIGEAELAVGQIDLARKTLRQAEAACSVSPGYRVSARAELARMQQ